MLQTIRRLLIRPECFRLERDCRPGFGPGRTVRLGKAHMNGLCERVIGTLRRECTDHVLVFHERQLERLLRHYVAYYNSSRTHSALERNAPYPRAPATAPAQELVATPVLGGLHHTYRRAA